MYGRKDEITRRVGIPLLSSMNYQNASVLVEHSSSLELLSQRAPLALPDSGTEGLKSYMAASSFQNH